MAAQRRMRTSTAAARGAAARTPRQSEQVRGTGYVSTSLTKRKEILYEDSKELDILQETFQDNEHPAFVKMSAGMTINLGNFESLRIDCAVTLPCHPENIQTAYETASDFVADRISEEQAEWLGEGNQTGKRKR